MKFFSKKLFLFISIFIIISFFYYLKLKGYFGLHHIQKNHLILKDFVQHHYFYSVFIFLSLFSILVACGFPIIIPFAVIGGFLYGVFWGLVFVSVSCLLGSLISFIVLRYIIAHWVRDWHNERLIKFNNRLAKYGYSYLLILHFLSVIPLFVINMLAAIANVPLRTILWVTFVGTFPLNLLGVLAGQQLSTIHSINEIFSPTIIILLCLLAAAATIPLLIKKSRGSFGL